MHIERGVDIGRLKFVHRNWGSRSVCMEGFAWRWIVDSLVEVAAAVAAAPAL